MFGEVLPSVVCPSTSLLALELGCGSRPHSHPQSPASPIVLTFYNSS